MLTYMRKHSRSWFIKIIFGAIILTFVAWGGSSYWAKEQNKIAKIDKHIISLQEYSKAYDNTLKAYQQQYGPMFTPEIIKMLKLNEKVLDQLINNYILEQEAKRMGVGVTDADLQEAIRSVPAFVSSGTFDMERYQRILDQFQLTPQQFEAQQRQEMIRERVYAIVTDPVFVTKDEVNAAYRARTDTLDLAYLTLDPEQFRATVTVGENDITAWYDTHKESYKLPPMTKIAYVVFEASRFLDLVQVTPQEVQDYYTNHIAEYTTPAKVRARHILIAGPSKADPMARPEQTASKVLEQAKSGADFAALAKQYSQDPATNQKGGELGLVEKQALPEGLGDALWAMKPGEIKGPIRTARGYHIVKLEEKQEAVERPLEEVSGAIMQILRERKAKDKAYDEANKAFSTVYETPQMDLAGFARQKNLSLMEFGPFVENGQIDLPMGAKVAKDAAARPQGDLGDLIDTGNGYLLYKVVDKIPARIPELKDVRDKLSADVIKGKLREAAQKQAQELAAQPKAQLEARHPEATGPFTRSAWAIPKLGMDAQLKKDLDNLQQAKVYTIGGKVYVVWLKVYQKADIAQLKEGEARMLREELLRQKKDQVFETFLKQAKARHDITIDREKLL